MHLVEDEVDGIDKCVVLHRGEVEEGLVEDPQEADADARGDRERYDKVVTVLPGDDLKFVEGYWDKERDVAEDVNEDGKAERRAEPGGFPAIWLHDDCRGHIIITLAIDETSVDALTSLPKSR